MRVPGRAILGVAMCMVVLSPVSMAGRKDNLAKWLTAGRAAMEDGLYGVAQKQFERYLRKSDEKSSSHEDVALLLLRVLYEQGKYDDMSRVTKDKKLLKGARDVGAFVFWRASAEFGRGNYRRASDLLVAFDTSYPGSKYRGKTCRLRAWTYLRLDESSKAMEQFALFDRLYGSSPGAPDNLLEWSRALIALGDREQAASVLSRLVGLSASLVPVQQGAYCLGQVQFDRSDFDAAAETWRSLATNSGAGSDLRAEAWYAVANAHEAMTNLSLAIGMVSNGLTHARSPQLVRRGNCSIGRLLVSVDRLDQGIPLLKAFVTETPDDPLADDMQLVVAEALLKHGKHQEAADEFQYYLETFTGALGQARASRGKGAALFNIGRYAEAATAYTKAFGLYDQSENKERCLFESGDSYFANGQYKLAAEAYGKLIREFPASKLAPRASFQTGECMFMSDEYEEARKRYVEVAAKFPTESFAEEALLRVAESNVRIAGSYGKQRRWIDAERAWNDALKSYDLIVGDRTNGVFYADALLGRGQVLFELFRLKEALKDFDMIVDRFPHSKVYEQAFCMQGMCYYRMVRDVEALRIWREFVRRFPESELAPKVLFEIAKYEFNDGSYEASEKQWVAFADKYKEHYLADDALLQAGFAASAQKEYVRASEIFARLAREYPSSRELDEARFAQADAMRQLGRYAAAIVIFVEILNKYPESDLVGATWLRRGDCQFMLGTEDAKRYEEAIGSYRVVENSSSADVGLALEAAYKSGKCMEKVGKMDGALEQYYTGVIVRYQESREKGAVLGPAADRWFWRAVRDAADILCGKKRWVEAVKIMERVIDEGVEGADEARERIRKIKADHWLRFLAPEGGDR